MQEELVSRLVKIGGLRVFRVRPGTDARESVAEVVRGLNVATVLGGSVHHAEGHVRVNLQLTRAATTESLWSDSYVREQSGIFAIQSEIALDVARALSIELSVNERRRIERVPTTDPGARELYLRARARWGRDTREQVLTAIEEVERALAYDEDFAEAWAVDAAFHGVAASLDPENAVEHTRRVEQAANRALALDGELAAAHTALGGVALAWRDWIGAEAAFRRAAALDPGSGPGPDVTLQLAVGNFARARDLIEQRRVAEPQNPTNHRLLAYSYAALGDWETASALYESGTLLFGDDANVVDSFQRMINAELHWFVARNEIAKARALALTDSLDIAMLASIDEPQQARVQLQQAFAGTSPGNPRRRRNIATWAGYFEDPVLALDAMRAAIDEQAGSAAFLWYPQLADMRQLPEFKEYLREIGIVDYWKEYGWPDICHPLGEKKFECD